MPKESGTFHVQIRGWLDNGSGSISVDPGSTGTDIVTDQQGYYALEYVITVNETQPDLTVLSASTPSTADAGETVSMSFDVKNIGELRSGATTNSEVRISTDQNFDHGTPLKSISVS